MMDKTCTGCGLAKPATTDYFHKSTIGKFGLAFRCKACVSAEKAEYYAKNAERLRLEKRDYVAANRAAVNARNRAAYAVEPEKFLERSGRRYQEHRDEAIAAARAWCVANPERRRANARVDNHRRRGASGSHTAADVTAQYERQHGRCYWCGVGVGDTYHVDHVIPIARGGSNGPENIVVACPPCNHRKHAKMPQDFPLASGQTTLC